MQLQIPFYKQTSNLNCGPVALKMIFDSFGIAVDLTEVEKIVGIQEGKIVFTSELALAAAKLGFHVQFYSEHLTFQNHNLPFYERLSVMTSDHSTKILQEAQKVGVELYERTLSLEQILEKISPNCVPLILLDWSKVVHGPNYIGHFVPIVGYDKESVYVHNHGTVDPTAYLKLPKEIFDQARIAKGTDQDILFISKN